MRARALPRMMAHARRFFRKRSWAPAFEARRAAMSRVSSRNVSSAFTDQFPWTSVTIATNRTPSAAAFSLYFASLMETPYSPAAWGPVAAVFTTYFGWQPCVMAKSNARRVEALARTSAARAWPEGKMFTSFAGDQAAATQAE